MKFIDRPWIPVCVEPTDPLKVAHGQKRRIACVNEPAVEKENYPAD